jgi:hypothetical protein
MAQAHPDGRNPGGNTMTIERVLVIAILVILVVFLAITLL